MARLADIMLTEGVRPLVLIDCIELLDREVEKKRGVTWAVLKKGYAATKAMNPGLLERAMNGMLNDFVLGLDRVYEDYLDAGSPDSFARFLEDNRERVVNILLEVPDGRSKRSRNAILKKLYASARPKGEKCVIDALPEIAGLVERYTK